MSATLTAPAVAAPRSPAYLAWRRFLGRPAAVAGALVVLTFVLVAVAAPLIAPFDPAATSWT